MGYIFVPAVVPVIPTCYVPLGRADFHCSLGCRLLTASQTMGSVGLGAGDLLPHLCSPHSNLSRRATWLAEPTIFFSSGGDFHLRRTAAGDPVASFQGGMEGMLRL